MTQYTIEQQEPVFVKPAAASVVVIWIGAAAVLAAVAGFTALGAAFAVTARFDENSDWSIHPALAWLGMGAVLWVGIVGTVLVLTASPWRKTERVGLVLVWLLAGAGAVFANSLGMALPVGYGWLIAGGVLLVGALLLVLVGRWAILASTRGARRP